MRDASFSVYALLGMGLTAEAEAFCAWLRDRIEEKAGGEGGPLRIMYRVDGSSDLEEESLDHLEGYRGSRPVRIGNGASGQRQMDIYGEAIDSIYFADQHGLTFGHRGWLALRDIVDCARRQLGPAGGKAILGDPRWTEELTYDRVMSWAALDRAIRLATSRGVPADLARWADSRDDIYRQVWDKGWNAGGALSCSTTTTRSSTRRYCGWPASASSRRATPVALDAPGHGSRARH